VNGRDGVGQGELDAGAEVIVSVDSQGPVVADGDGVDDPQSESFRVLVGGDPPASVSVSAKPGDQVPPRAA